MPRKKKTAVDKVETKIEEQVGELPNTPEEQKKVGPPPGKPVTSIAKIDEPQPESAPVEALNVGETFQDSDLVEKAIDMLNVALAKSREDNFQKVTFSYHELEFLLKIVTFAKTKSVQSNKIIHIYTDRDHKARQKLVELAELLKLTLRMS